MIEPGTGHDLFRGWPSAKPGKEIGTGTDGVFAGGFWFLGVDCDGVYLAEAREGVELFPFGAAGVTLVVGDWDADGTGSVEVQSNRLCIVDYDGDRVWNPETNWGTEKIFRFGWTGAGLMLGD